MRVTAEQCAHAQAERQRPGNKQNNLLESDSRQRRRCRRQRAREKHKHHKNCSQHLRRDAESSTRVGLSRAFSGDENTWGDWIFKLRSCVSVADLQLGRMMEEAEQASHANAWQLVNQDMDAQFWYLLVMLTSGPALQIIRQQPSAVQAFRYLARSVNPRLPARSLAQLPEFMHFDVGQESAGVTDRLIVFERLVGEYETSSGELLGVQVECAVLLKSVQPELRIHLLLTCGSGPDYTIKRQTVKSF